MQKIEMISRVKQYSKHLNVGMHFDQIHAVIKKNLLVKLIGET